MEVMAVYPGRFHPFHKGHAGSFNQLLDQFGEKTTLLAISGKQEQPKSPFSAIDRAKMAIALGVPKTNILTVSQPYKAEEYIKYLQDRGQDPQNWVLVFGVSKKDMEGVPEMGIPPDPRFQFKPKRDGSPSYLQPYVGNENKLKSMMQHAYVISTDVAEFPVAGQTMRDASAIRDAYKRGDEDTRKRILHDLYGSKAAKHIKPIFDRELLQNVDELKEFYQRIKPLLSEASLQKRLQIMKTLIEARKRKTKRSRRSVGRVWGAPWGWPGDSAEGGGEGVAEESNDKSIDDITSAFVEHYKEDPVGMFMHAKSSYLDAVGKAKNFSVKAAQLYKSHQSMSKSEFQNTVMAHFGPHLMKHGFPKHASTGWGEAEHDMMKALTGNVSEAGFSAQQAAIAINMKKAGKKPKKMKESVDKINRFKLIELLEQSIKVLPHATPSQRKVLNHFVKEAQRRLNSSSRPNSHHTEHDIELLERELTDKGVCFWPSTVDESSDRYMAENYRKVSSHGRQLDKILRMHFNDTQMSENKFNRIVKELIARNIARELNYAGVNSNITETIDYNNPQLQQILKYFNKFGSDNRPVVDDELCVLQLDILKYRPEFRGSITLRGFTKPKKVIAVDDYYIHFDDHTRWPDVRDYKNTKIAKQTIYLKNPIDADKCVVWMSLLSSKNMNDIYDVEIYVDKEEPLDKNIFESSSQEIIDYLEESVMPQDEFPNKEMLAKQPGNIVWWKQSMVGTTTGNITDHRVEFKMRDGKYGYLPLNVVSIRPK